MAIRQTANVKLKQKAIGKGKISQFQRKAQGLDDVDVPQNKDERFKAKMRIWVGYWRCNLHRFAEDMGVRLHFFQSILLVIIDIFPNFIYIASRGTGKSFLIALYAILKAILYPNIKIVISSATKGQSILMIKQYVRYFANEYDLIQNEIESISDNMAMPAVIFKNGSTIKAVTASDSSRGEQLKSSFVI